MSLYLRCSSRIEGRQVFPEDSIDGYGVKGWQTHGVEKRRGTNWFSLAGCGQVAFCGFDRLVDFCSRGKRAEIIHRKRTPFRCRYRRCFFPKCGVVVFYPSSKLLELLVQRHCLSAKDQLVELLPMSRINGQTRIDVLVNEHVVEHSQVRQCAVPGIILEHRRRRTAVAFQNNMRGILRGKPTPLRNRDWVASC